MEDKFDLKTLSTLKPFSKRIRYCNTRLKRISSGSSRVVYEFDSKKVLKLARNKKGVAQNNVEAEGLGFLSGNDTIPTVYKVDSDDLWILVEKARKMRMADFKRILGYSFKDFTDCVDVMFSTGRGNNERRRELEKEFPDIFEDEFFNEILGIGADLDLVSGDLIRPSSYGVIGNRVVLLDYGCTTCVYNDYYVR